MPDIPTCCLSLKRWAFERYGPFRSEDGDCGHGRDGQHEAQVPCQVGLAEGGALGVHGRRPLPALTAHVPGVEVKTEGLQNQARQHGQGQNLEQVTIGQTLGE